MSARFFERLGLALLLVVVLTFLVLLLLVPGRAEPLENSALSAEDEGQGALFAMAKSLGLPVASWSSAPGKLTGPGTLLVLAGLPTAPEPAPDAVAEASRGGRDLTHYRRFVEEGGTLLVLGEDAEALDFLCDAELPGCAELSYFGHEARATSVSLSSGTSFALDPGPHGEFEFEGEGAAGEVLLRSAPGGAAGVLLRAGAGRVAVLAFGGAFFSNEHLAASSAPALLFVRVVEALGPFERILFDEYALGGWVPPSVLTLFFQPRFAWLSVHVLLLVLVLGWRSAWSGPFPRDPEGLLAASPLARAQGFARTLIQARRWDLLARLLQRGLLERWCLRAGLRAPPVDAARRSEPAALAESLSALARGDERLLQRLDAAQGEHARRDEAAFEELARELSALEGELFPLESGKMRAQRGHPASRTRS
ncbi:MAG: DUF4350 domain-containing protein [Planctomycetes bacterium]|nr:DUF4350 domain-containing protein [Planctomycetota bacterium]